MREGYTSLVLHDARYRLALYCGSGLDTEEWKGRADIVRYQWTDVSPHAAKMEPAFSADGGRGWDVNWVCELSR
jgi:hypothetical protein